MKSLFKLGKYLPLKNKTVFVIPVLAAFLCTSCLSSVVKRHGFSTEVNEKPMPYDIPPTAPIPPEKYCFEQKIAGATAKIELNLVGDSAFGKIDYAKAGSAGEGEFRGIIYGNAVIVTYKFKTDTGVVNLEQRWKFAADSIYKIDISHPLDSITMAKDSTYQLHFSGAFYKVACK